MAQQQLMRSMPAARWLCLLAVLAPLLARCHLTELPICEGCEEWPAHAGADTLLAESAASPACSAALNRYLVCKAQSGIFAACSNDALLKSSDTLRALLRCTDASVETCKKNCIEDAGRIINGTIDKPCSADFQAMHGFGAQLDIFTVGSINKSGIPSALLMPLPNMKNMKGPTLIKFGEPAHCAEIPSAQYCVISGSLKAGTGGEQSFTFALGNCLPKSCTEDEYRGILKQTASSEIKVMVQCDLVRPVAEAEGSSKQVESLLGWGGIPVYYPNGVEITVGAVLTGSFVLVLVILSCLGTWMEWSRELGVRDVQLQGEAANSASGVRGEGLEAAVPFIREFEEPPPPSAFANFVNHWSFIRNFRSLTRKRQGAKNPFACVDFLKVFSMAQVILGHSYFYILSSIGFSNMEQFSPPYGLLGRFWFQIIPGCFYGVDSFFVISGFLCAIGLEAKLFNNPANRKPARFSCKYIQFLLFRWLRLVPTQMFCIAFSTTLLPHLGTGVLWNLDEESGGHCYEANGSRGCDEYWWTNLLFIQDLDKYVGKCYGHTWYLANDFQMYATAPFFGLAYSFNRKKGWGLLTVAMLVGLSIPTIMTAQHDWVPEIIAGSSKGFAQKFYMKPWCRCPAFFLGIGMGWAWPSFFEQFKGRPMAWAIRLRSYGLSLVAVAFAAAATFGRMSFFDCTLENCFDPERSPVPRFLQYIWASFGILTWCVGFGLTMILCFSGKFLPPLQQIFDSTVWQPLAKLSYSAYLIHTSVLILGFCQKDSPIEYMPSTMFFNFVAFTATSLVAAFWVFMLVEKPCANLQMALLGGGGD